MLERTKKYRILVVDDEPDITLVFRTSLEQAGFDVDAFNDPQDALAQVTAGKYDLLLLDIRMLKMNGFELYKAILKIDDKPKVCFITAFEIYYDEFKRVFPNLHVKCFIRKPISTKDLVKQVRAELESPPIPDKAR